MSLSYDSFVKACNAFCLAWSRIDSSNHWESVKIHDAAGSCKLQIAVLLAEEQITVGSGQVKVDGCASLDGEADPEALRKVPSNREKRIVYEIIHSPSYQVPVLYLTLQGDRHRFSLDEIYKHVVPPRYKQQVRNVGIMGALSITDHPISGTPTYFVHPCRTVDAMQPVLSSKPTPPEEYLTLWFGLIGPSVGLNMPIELARSMFAA